MSRAALALLCSGAQLSLTAASGLRGLAARGGDDCVRQDDCSISAWCKDDSFIAWCANPAHLCQAPFCIHSGSSPTTSPTPTTPEPTLAPTLAPTNAPTTSAPVPSAGIGAWFTAADFAAFFPNIDNAACTGKGFFSHAALLAAAKAFPTFANSGDQEMDKRELAAFLGQTSHETTGGWSTAPGGPQAWGYCFKEEVGCEQGQCTQYCAAGNPCETLGLDCACVAGQTYQGRGPMQLSWNYNYGPFSEAIFNDPSILLKNPSAVASNATLAYMAGLWFWMTPQSPKPSCHDVMIGAWTPTAADTAAGRVPGYGMVTNIINGGLECNQPTSGKVEDRVLFYERFAAILGVSVDASTLYCDSMQSYR